tara:strand:+ start:1220 stop:1432 length:213 start_codon:yes stop_codon:yes gene_type:complete
MNNKKKYGTIHLITPVMGEPTLRNNSEKELEEAFKDQGFGLLDVYHDNDVSPEPVDHDNDSVNDNDSVKD